MPILCFSGVLGTVRVNTSFPVALRLSAVRALHRGCKTEHRYSRPRTCTESCLRPRILCYWRNYAASRNLPGSQKSGDLVLVRRHVEGVPEQYIVKRRLRGVEGVAENPQGPERTKIFLAAKAGVSAAVAPRARALRAHRQPVQIYAGCAVGDRKKNDSLQLHASRHRSIADSCIGQPLSYGFQLWSTKAPLLTIRCG